MLLGNADACIPDGDPDGEKLGDCDGDLLGEVVGDAEGIPAGVATQVRERWSLSYHELARLLDLEALYRSFDILRGGNYHK